MTIWITDLYNDDTAKFDSLREAHNYFLSYDEECEGDWEPLVVIDGKPVTIFDFFEMCRKAGI